MSTMNLFWVNTRSYLDQYEVLFGSMRGLIWVNNEYVLGQPHVLLGLTINLGCVNNKYFLDQQEVLFPSVYRPSTFLEFFISVMSDV